MRTILRSSSNRDWARAFASSVLPTPVGPRKMKDPMGRFSSLSPARPRRMASLTAVTASSCPMTRRWRMSGRRRSFSFSLSTSLLTGTPVQALTTEAISSSVTSSFSRCSSFPASTRARSSSSCFSSRGRVSYFRRAICSRS